MRVIILTVILALCGCAGTNVSRISNENYKVAGKYNDEQADGIRYYESAPFLLVYSDGKGSLKSELLYLPDLTQKRVIDPFNFLAANNSTLTFVNGILTQGKTIVDETVVPKAMIGALEKAAAASLAGTLNAAGIASPTQLPPPQLFKIVLKDGAAKLVGGAGVDQAAVVRMIDVTIPEPEEPGTAAKAKEGQQ